MHESLVIGCPYLNVLCETWSSQKFQSCRKLPKLVQGVMLFPNVRALHHPVLVEPEEAEVIWPWVRGKFWRVFSLTLTFIGFLICFACAFYFMLFKRSEYIYCTIGALICLTVFVHLVAGNCPFVNTARAISAVPVQIASADHFREVLRKTQSESAISLVPERADLFNSLPAYILIPAGKKDRDEASNTSTESTLSAESAKRHEDETELLINPQKQEVIKKAIANGGPFAAEKLSKAASVISRIVKDAILDKEVNASTVVTTAVEQSSDNSSEKGKEGVRQRKPTPMEAREYINLTENLKA